MSMSDDDTYWQRQADLGDRHNARWEKAMMREYDEDDVKKDS